MSVDYASVARVQMFSAVAGGIVLLAVPGVLLALFGIASTAHVDVLARMLGGVLFALGATLAAARGVTDRPSQIRVCVGNAVCDGAIALFLAVNVVNGSLGLSGWALVAVFAVNCLSWLIALRPATVS